jgi:hypothetical protein
MVAAGEIEGFPIVPAKGNVGGGGSAVHDAAELFALGVHDPDAASSTTIDVALGIHLHAVRDPGLGAAQTGEPAVALPGERAVGVPATCGSQRLFADLRRPRFTDDAAIYRRFSGSGNRPFPCYRSGGHKAGTQPATTPEQ